MSETGSLNRAAILLSALASSPRGLTSIAELARRTGLPRPTVYRVVEMLMVIGWVDQDVRTRQLGIGGGLVTLGRAGFVDRLERIAGVELSLLARKLDQTIYLDIQSGLDLVCVGRYPARSAEEKSYGYDGMHAPFGVTPATMAMLARMPADMAGSIMTANRDRYEAIAGFDRKGFKRSYERARESDAAIYDAIILDRRMCGIGAAICAGDGHPVAGIGLAHARSAMTPRLRSECSAKISAAARRIEERLWVGAAA